MSGHSKWSSIKHKKAKTDAARGKLFTRLIREVTVAARQGGGDPNANPRLRLAMDTARAANMPNDNITRAIKKGTGELEGVSFDEFTYEGYGPGGVAFMIDVLTDNRNRTTAEVRHALSKHGGNLGETGSVAWNFERKGVVRVEKSRCDEDTLMDAALEAGAEDVQDGDEMFDVYTAPADLHGVAAAVDGKSIPYVSAGLERVPSTTVKLEAGEARKVLRLLDALEELDDVQSVSANFDIPDEVFEED